MTEREQKIVRQVIGGLEVDEKTPLRELYVSIRVARNTLEDLIEAPEEKGDGDG